MMQNVLVLPKTATIAPKGHLNAANADLLKQQLSAIVASEDCSRLLVDMHQVESLDSAGLMALVAALTLAQQRDKRFSLCCVPPAIRIIFELTQLDRAFEIFESRTAYEAAIA